MAKGYKNEKQRKNKKNETESEKILATKKFISLKQSLLHYKIHLKF